MRQECYAIEAKIIPYDMTVDLAHNCTLGDFPLLIATQAEIFDDVLLLVSVTDQHFQYSFSESRACLEPRIISIID